LCARGALDGGGGRAKHAGMDDAAPTGFTPCDEPPPLTGAAVHAWLIEAPADWRARDVSVAARAALGRLLRAYAGTDDEPEIAIGAHGKPYTPALPWLQFNLSHAGHHALLAFSRGQALGVDLERLDRRIAADDIAARFYHPLEAQAIAGMAHEIRTDAFLALWTRKEAVLKALGAGLSFGLERIRFAFGPDGDVHLAACAPEAGLPGGWQVLPLAPAHALVGALAWHGPPRRLHTFRYTQALPARRSAVLQRP
jgi:4'-phosphopantetheinyl transferase